MIKIAWNDTKIAKDDFLSVDWNNMVTDQKGRSRVYSGTSAPSGSVTPEAVGDIYIKTDTKVAYIATGTANTDWEVIDVGVWGDITGTLSNQIDLQTALNLKYDSADFNTDWDTRLATKDTGDLSEGSNLYYTEVRVSANTNVVANTAKVTNATHTGDVTGSGALTIIADAVTYAKMQDMATDRILGRSTAGVGDVEELSTLPTTVMGNISIPSSQISDFDTEVANNTDVTANTAKVTNATHTGDVTGATALTIGVDKINDTHIDWGTGANQVSQDDVVDGSTYVQTHNDYTDTEQTKVGHLTVTQAVDLDTMESDIVTNNAKVTNATHTGDVTGSGALSIASNIIDEDNLKATNAPTDNYILSYDSGTGGFTWVVAAGGGDMTVATYDPASITEQLVGLTAIQTLTNKTLTSPNINEAVALTSTSTELNYVDGVTGAIQGQIDGKQASLTFGIANTNVVDIDSATVADDDYAKFTVNGLEGRSYAEVRTDLGLVIGTDVLAEQTIGIADDNLVEMDDLDAAATDYAKFTANGLEGRSYAEVRSDINVADGADVTGSNVPQAHKDSHDPNDGGDALDTANAREISVVVAAGAGVSHSFSRSDHIHAINHSIADNHLVTIDQADAADDEYARFTANGIESRSVAEAKTDLGFISDVVDDTSPELGGELDAGAHSIGFTAQTATGDGATTIDWKLGNKFEFTFGAQNDTFTFTAPTNPGNFVLKMIQDGTGSRTATWPATVKWPGGTAPTLTTTASAVDIISFYWDGTNYYGVGSLDFS